MGIYGNHVLPRFLNWIMAADHFAVMRGPALAQASGVVLEVGFGSGLNLPFYPTGVERLLALEPAGLARKLAGERIAQAPFPVAFAELDVQGRILLADHSVDTVVTAWTLCTIPDPSLALREFQRVLKPGGRYLFIEHGLSPDLGVARWQNFMTPIQRRCVGGCHHNRRIEELIAGSGFEIRELEKFYDPGQARVGGYIYRGSAHPLKI